MKVLYLASKTPEMQSLSLEREVTALQRRIGTSSVNRADFVFLPDVKVEDLPLEITRRQPDVLHISVHGSEAGLWFANEANRPVQVRAEHLRNMLPAERLPRLVVLNACDSNKVASDLAALSLVAIGSTAPITNRAAIASATVLYDRLLSGQSIEEAFKAMDAVVQTLEGGLTQLEIHTRAPELKALVLHRPVTLVAKLDPAWRPGKKAVWAYIGVAGCPAAITQICFFTDDPSFEKKGKSHEDAFTEVIRNIPRGGEVWTKTTWEPDGDFRVGACAMTSTGEPFAVSALLSDALERYAEAVSAPARYHKRLGPALQFLRDNNGAGLAEWQDLPAVSKARDRIKQKNAAEK